MNINVLVLANPSKASRHYRVEQPYGYIKDKLGKNIVFYNVDDHKHKADLDKKCLLADVIICQYSCVEEGLNSLKFIKESKDKTRKLVIDYDDDIINISPWNPHYVEFGTEEVNTVYTDKEQVKKFLSIADDSMKKNIEINPDGTAFVAMWKDKKGKFNLKRNRLLFNQLNFCCLQQIL